MMIPRCCRDGKCPRAIAAELRSRAPAPKEQPKRKPKKQKKKVCSAALAEQVFGNRAIMDNILGHLTDEMMHNLELRLVSKAFNSGSLRRVRVENRNLKVGGVEGAPKNWEITVQEVPMSVSHFPKFCDFLKTVAVVKIRELECGDWIRDAEWAKRVHDELLELLEHNGNKPRKVRGMREICSTICSKCDLFID